MPIYTDYVPKYVEMEDVPLEGPDQYTDSDKRKALFDAESEFELDVNDGATISDDDVTDSYQAAVANLATYHLANMAVAPDDVTLGDMADGGGQSRDYADSYLETYNRLIEKILQTSEAGSSRTHTSVSVNTRDSDRMEHEYPYDQDDRFP